MDSPEPIEPPKRRWSWRQYSLSTLLVVVTILSVALGMVTNRAERQRRAVAAIREAGGTVTYDFERDDGSPNEPPGPDWLRGVLGVDYFADVASVRASGMTDATCSHLSALTSLQELHLDATHVTDGGLAHVSGAGLAHLAGLTNLESLYLAGAQVADAGLEHLAGLTSLKELWLNGTQVTDVGLAHLAGLTSLQWLELDGTQVTNAGLAHLTGLTSLQVLVLNDTQVTNAGLAHLAGLADLRYLALHGTQVTGEGRDKLRRALPSCSIYH